MSGRAEESVVSLDIGEKNIGAARAYLGSLFPRPCAVIAHDDSVIASLVSLLKEEQAVALVVGLPRSLSGDETQQTQAVRAFTNNLRQQLDIPLFFQDEAGTSRQAEQELAGSMAKRTGPAASKDALAAVYILEDFIKEGRHRELLN